MLLANARLGGLALVTALTVSLAGLAGAPVASAALGSNQFDAEVVRLVNVERAKRRLPKVIAVPYLTIKARKWSKVMASGNGSAKFKHASKATIRADHKAALCTGSWSENIYFATGRVPDPKSVVAAYMSSAGHRGTILKKSFRYMASGSALGSTSVYNTQRFAESCDTRSKVTGWSTKQSITVKRAAKDTIKVTGSKRVVALQKYTSKKWVTVKKFTTNSAGKVTITFPASKSTKKVKYRTLVAANSKYRATKSKTKILTYKKPSKVVGWSTKQTITAQKTAKDTIKATGSKRIVTLQKHTGKKWRTVKTFTTNSAGKVKIAFPVSSSAKKIKYRAVVSAQAKYSATTSKTKVLTYAK